MCAVFVTDGCDSQSLAAEVESPSHRRSRQVTSGRQRSPGPGPGVVGSTRAARL